MGAKNTHPYQKATRGEDMTRHHSKDSMQENVQAAETEETIRKVTMQHEIITEARTIRSAVDNWGMDRRDAQWKLGG